MPRVPRIVLLGSSTVGKSALVAALLGQHVDLAEYEPTQAVSVCRTNACIASLSPSHSASDVCLSQPQPFLCASLTVAVEFFGGGSQAAVLQADV